MRTQKTTDTYRTEYAELHISSVRMKVGGQTGADRFAICEQNRRFTVRKLGFSTSELKEPFSFTITRITVNSHPQSTGPGQ